MSQLRCCIWGFGISLIPRSHDQAAEKKHIINVWCTSALSYSAPRPPRPWCCLVPRLTRLPLVHVRVKQMSGLDIHNITEYSS